MKHSIRVKLTFLLTGLVIFTIFLIWFINRTFLQNFYLTSKLQNLANTYASIEVIYHDTEDDTALGASAIEKLDKLASANNAEVFVYVVKEDGFYYSYPSPDNIGINESTQYDYLLREYLYPGSNPRIRNKVQLKQTENYRIYKLFDVQKDTNYIDLIGVIGQDKLVLMRTNYVGIQESVAISNKFLAYIGLLAVLIGSTAMLMISRKFTQPIQDLAGIAKKMSDLDFNIKYEVTTKDEIGELGSSINTLSDKLEKTITELKQANNELLSDIQRKTEIDEMRKEFLSNVSHELKTPLSIIQGYAEGLKENINEDEESRNFYCEIIMDEADKMNKMVKKLLTLNELEFGNNKVNFERFDIIELIQSVLSAAEILFKQKNVMLHFEEKGPIYVWADEYLVEQVVTNYISNALNHVDGAKIIEVKIIQKNDVVRIAVFNTGENIPEEELDKIWIKFHKVDKARTREYGGNGIGLSIVKAIMNSLNRECGVINRTVGVEFWFELDSKA